MFGLFKKKQNMGHYSFIANIKVAIVEVELTSGEKLEIKIYPYTEYLPLPNIMDTVKYFFENAHKRKSFIDDEKNPLKTIYGDIKIAKLLRIEDYKEKFTESFLKLQYFRKSYEVTNIRPVLS